MLRSTQKKKREIEKINKISKRQEDIVQLKSLLH